MNELSAAMQRVDAIGGGGEPFAMRPGLRLAGEPENEKSVALDKSPPAPDVPPVSVESLIVEGASRPLKAATLRGMAATLVSLAKEAGGQDPRHFTPFDQLTAENIGTMLTAIMDAKAVELPAAFRQGSAPADVGRADAVAKALNTEGNGG